MENALELVLILNLFQAWNILMKRRRKLLNRRRALRRWWVRLHNNIMERFNFGAYNQIFTYFKINDHEEFFAFTRMSVSQYNYLHELLKPMLEKKSIRKPLPTELCLAAALNFLARGDSVRTTAWFFRIGRSTMYKIIRDVSAVICEILMLIYLHIPDTAEWLHIARGFEDIWNYPNCLGAIDGKHIRINAPMRTGSAFHNYKAYFSFVLLASCDAHYRFTCIDVGDYGSLNDAGIFMNTEMGKALEQKMLIVPQPRTLPRSNAIVPFAFVGDEGFPLKTYMMRPYARRNLLGRTQKIFNYRLSRARRVIENTFGILVARWAILQGSLRLKLETSENIVQALACLHNYIITHEMEERLEKRRYLPSSMVDREVEGHVIPGDWRQAPLQANLWRRLGRVGANFAGAAAVQQRDSLANYFSSEEGAVPWQWESIYN